VGIQQNRLNRLVIGCVVTGFLALVLAGLLGIAVMARNLDFTDWVTHTYKVENAIADYRILNERLETARRGYLLSSEPSFARTYRATARQLPAAIDKIQRLTADNPQQQARVAELRKLQQDQIAADDISIATPAASRAALAKFGADAGVTATRRIRVITQAMDADENQKLLARDKARIGTVSSMIALVAAAGLLLLVVAISSTWIILRYTRDLSRSRNALAELNAGLEEEVKSRTAELRRANEEIQRFAYIVSHDLRAPLVNVMGFTGELEAAAKPLGQLLARAEVAAPGIVSPEARLAVTSDLPESIGFIRASTQKMDRLINAILRLSREGRRVLAPEGVDLNTLFGGIADSLKHRVDELGADIEIAPNLPGLVSDRLALEQIFSNLIENALKYLKPDRPGRIEVRAHRRGERVVVEIADNGRGVDPKDHARIFDLFRRSGAQDQPGEGIGLAHVRALGYRVGATVTIDSALDAGATFRVSLPATLSPEAAAA
jgi:signal transduction histidine kinase